MIRTRWIAAVLALGLVAVAGSLTAQNRHQWPADTVFFTDLEDLQEKLDEGSLGGGGALEKTGTTIHPIASATDSLATGSTDCTTAEFCAQPSGALKAGVVTSINPSSATGGNLTLAESTAAGAHTWTLQAPADLTASTTCAIGADGSLGCAPAPTTLLARTAWIYTAANTALSDTTDVCGAFQWALLGGALPGVTLATGTITLATPGTYRAELMLGATFTWVDAGDYTRQHWTVDTVWYGSEAVIGIPGGGTQVSRQLMPYAAATFVVAGAPVVLRICTGTQGAGTNDLVPASAQAATTLVTITRIDL